MRSNNKVLKQLRRKFIVLNMTIAALALAIAFGTVCYVNHQSNENEILEALSSALNVAAAENADVTNSRTWDSSPAPEESAAQSPATLEATATQTPASDTSATNLTTTDAASTTDQLGTPPEIGRRHDDPNASSGNIIPTAIYKITSEGISSLPNHSTATISTSTVQLATNAALDAGSTSGYLADYDLYFERRSANSAILIAFADASLADGWKNLALTLVVIGIAALACLFAINLAFSRWALKPVEETWTQQKRFISDASHELKTPLTVILANASILHAHGNSTVQSQMQWVEGISAEGKRMQHLVAEMLELARLDQASVSENAQPKPAPAAIDLSDFLEGEILQFESVAFESGMEIETDIQPNVQAKATENELQHIVGVLLDNACKYGSNAHPIKVALSANNKQATLSVTNFGNPISADDLGHIFDRFYKASTSRTKNSEGSAYSFGLGLAIARENSEKLGGTLSATSTKESGTTFTLTIPLD